MSNARPLSECTREDLVNYHALVYGRARIWHKGLSDGSEFQFHWSKHAWWKAMWYPHRGGPNFSGAWGVYAGGDGFTGPGDAELTHWLPVPPDPRDTVQQPAPSSARMPLAGASGQDETKDPK